MIARYPNSEMASRRVESNLTGSKLSQFFPHENSYELIRKKIPLLRWYTPTLILLSVAIPSMTLFLRPPAHSITTTCTGEEYDEPFRGNLFSYSTNNKLLMTECFSCFVYLNWSRTNVSWCLASNDERFHFYRFLEEKEFQELCFMPLIADRKLALLSNELEETSSVLVWRWRGL